MLFNTHTNNTLLKRIIRINDEFILQVRIGFDDKIDKILIKGPKEEAERIRMELKTRILKLTRGKMNDVEEKEIKTDRKFFKEILGTNGERIRQLRSQFAQVQMIFPYNFDENHNILKLRGPQKDVNAASEHFEKFYGELVKNSYSIKVMVCKIFHKNLIGKRGARISQLREETSTRIHLPEATSDSQLVEIIGTKSNVRKARNLILEFQRDQIDALMNEIGNRQPLKTYQFPSYRLENMC